MKSITWHNLKTSICLNDNTIDVYLGKPEYPSDELINIIPLIKTIRVTDMIGGSGVKIFKEQK